MNLIDEFVKAALLNTMIYGRSPEKAAEMAYAQAEAMMEERKKHIVKPSLIDDRPPLKTTTA